MDIQRFLILIISLILLGACTPSIEEKATPTKATIIAPTIPAAITNTLPPPRIVTHTPTPKATAVPPEELLIWNTPNPFSATPTPRIIPTSMQFDPITTRVSKWPELENDILFLIDNSLQLWDHENRELVLLLPSTAKQPDDDYSYVPIPGEITDYQVSPEGRAVIVSRVIALEPRIDEFILIDLTSRENTIIASGGQLSKPSFSPDGRQIAYITGEAEFANELVERYEVVIKNVFNGEPPQLIDYCFNKLEDDPDWVYICLTNRIVWSRDGNSLQWSDRRGVVSLNLSTRITEIITPHENIGVFPVELSEIHYRALDWSPNGRFLRLAASGWEYYEPFIYDTESRQLFEIPNSYGGLGPEIYTIWLSDDRIFLARNLYNYDESQAEISRFDALTDKWVIESIYLFPSNDDNYTYPTALAKLEDGTLGLAIHVNQELASTVNLYKSESLAAENLQFNQPSAIIPDNNIYSVHWSPNGSGAIVAEWLRDNKYTIQYTSIEEGVIYDLGFSMVNGLPSIYWLP